MSITKMISAFEWAPYCSYHVNFTNVDPQIVCKMPDFSTLSALGKRMLCSKERYPLLLKCFITFIRCMRKTGGAPDSICRTLLVHTVSFLPRMTLPNFIQNARFGVPHQHWKCHTVPKGETSIAVEVFQKLPLMHDKDGKISWQHLRAPCGSYRAFLAKVYSQISHKKYQVWSILSAQQMGWYTVLRGIGCYWSIS